MYIDIQLPRGSEYSPQAATALLTALNARYAETYQEYVIEATSFGIFWSLCVGDDSFTLETAQSLINSYYPNAVVSATGYAMPEVFPIHQVRAWLTPPPFVDYDFFAPYLSASEVVKHDPLTLISQAMDDLSEGEAAGYFIASIATRGPEDKEFADFLMTATRRELKMTPHDYHTPDMAGAFVKGWQQGKWLNERVPKFHENDERIFRAKLARTRPLVAICVYCYAQSLEKARNKVASLLIPLESYKRTNFRQFGEPERRENLFEDADHAWKGHPRYIVGNWFDEPDPPAPKKKGEPRQLLTRERFQLDMTEAELAAFWHLPHSDMVASKITWIKSAQVPLPPAMKSMPAEHGVLMGVNRTGGQEANVYLPHEGRDRHAAIIGKSGTGKSSLMLRLIHEDIAMGRGVCVLDPHGDLVRDTLRYSIPPEREGDVVILDIANELDGVRYPPPLNPLARSVGGDLRYSEVVNRVMNVFEKGYPGFSETQMGYILKNCLYTLEHENTPNLFDAQRLFRDPHYRASMVDKLTNIATRDFWRTFSKQSATNLEKAWFPLQRRLAGFFDSNETLAISCHPKPISLPDMMRQSKIVLVSLGGSGGTIGDAERQLLGAAVVSQVQMAAMSGAIAQKPFMLYIDEAQNFVSSALPKILSEARKYGLALHLANQYFKQLAGDTLDAIEGNIGTMFAFEVGEKDAKDLDIFMGEKFTTDDLAKMGNYRAAVTTRYQNERQPPFSLETLPPPGHGIDEATGEATERRIRENSIKNYTPMTEDEVIAAILKRLDELPVSEDDDGDFYEQPPTDQPKEE